jgi:hypothetical protein
LYRGSTFEKFTVEKEFLVLYFGIRLCFSSRVFSSLSLFGGGGVASLHYNTLDGETMVLCGSRCHQHMR